MTIQVFGAEATVSALNRAFNDVSPSNAIFTNQVAAAKSMGDAAFAAAFGASFAGVSNAALSKQVLTNMGILPTTDTSVAALEQALTDYFAAFGTKTTGTNGQVTADTRGFIVLQLSTILSGLENATGNQAVYTKAASAWNNEVAGAFSYSNDSTNKTPSAAGGTVANGTTFTLTTGVDTLVGTEKDDTFTGATDAFSALDNVDGGAGTDSLTAMIAGTGFPASASVKNVENISITTSATSAASFNASTFTGVAKLAITAPSATAATTITAPTTASITALSANAVTVVGGGGTAAVTAGAAAVLVGKAASPAASDANSFTAVTAVGGTTVDITDNSAKDAAGTATGAVGKTLTTVSLNGNTDAATITANGLTTLNLTNLVTASKTTTVTVPTAGTRALTINTNGVTTTGKIADAEATTLTVANSGAKSTGLVVEAVKATAMNLSATGADLSIATLTGATGVTKAVNISGDSAVAVGTTGTASSLTLDAAAVITSTNTKGTTINPLLLVGQKFVGGAGADSIKLTTSATVASTMGDGDDTVTLPTPFAFAAGGSVDGGAGNDTLLVAGTYTSTGVTGFETLGVAPSGSGTLDATGFTGLTESSIGGTVTFNNVAAGVGLKVTASTGAQTTIVNVTSATAATNTSDALTVTVGSTATPAVAVDASTISAPGVENLTIVSNGLATNTTAMLASAGSPTANNAVILGGDLQAKTVTISGASDLYVTVAAPASSVGFGGSAVGTPDATNGGVSSIDASAATGRVYLDTANVIASKSGIAIKGGAGADTIKIGTSLASTVNTITLGAGKDTVEIAAANTDSSVFSIITDFAAGDVIKLAALGNSGTTLGAKLASAVDDYQTFLNAACASTTADNKVTWFQLGGNTYVVQNNDATAGYKAGVDTIVKLVGLVDLSGATVDTTAKTITMV